MARDRPARRIVPAVALLAIVQAAVSSRAVQDLEFVGNYDTAYYYTVARNLALGRGLTDTVRWHHLGPDGAVERPAGDYWLPGWPMLLGTLMRVSGHSAVDAMRLCAALSVFLPVLAFWTTRQIRRQTGTALLAGLLVCAQARLLQTNVTPDVTLCYQLFTLLGLGGGLRALAHDGPPARSCGAGVMLALPLWVRGEGFVALLSVLLGLLAWGRGSRRRRAALGGWMLLGAACGAAPLLLYNLVTFGRITPLPRALIFWMRSYGELYCFKTDPSFDLWWSQGAGKILADRFACLATLADHLRLQIAWPLLAAAGAGMLTGLVRRRVEVLCLSLFLALTALVPAALVPLIANPDRLVMHAIPVLCVLAATAVGDLVEFVRGALPRAGWVVAGTASVLLLAGCVLVRAPMNARGHFERGWQGQFRPVPPHLAAAARRLGLKPDDVVLTQDPWQVAAVLDVRTVMIPYDGPDALRRVLKRYRPRFVLLSDEGSPSSNQAISQFYYRSIAILRDCRYEEALAVGHETWYAAAGTP